MLQLTSKRLFFIFFLPVLLHSGSLFAQPLSGNRPPSRQDSLRGSLNAARSWWNVTHYAISVDPDFDTKTIKGSVNITIEVLQQHPTLQLDLQEPMQIDRIESNGTQLAYKREGNHFHVTMPASFTKGSKQTLIVSFSGKPTEAARPPWDGGWIWRKDKLGNPWMSVACQGLGASVWFPCKDHQSDEPENGASLQIVAPKNLTAVGNGRLTATTTREDGRTVYTWEVKNPINNYNIIPYIGKYVQFSETFDGEKGKLDCSYWVLEQDLDAAKKQFKQVAPMLKCFENWFGPYPFYEDGYKLVQAPHLGMEHQSAVAYGNQFKNGYLGKDLSGSGWGLKWDFIIIHESGHEWFGNNITTADIADMWVHEGFTNYSETLFTQCEYGKAAGDAYLQGSRRGIANDIPIIGTYGVNREGSGDMYPKAASMIHTIRQLIDNDDTFRQLLRNMNKDFYHQIVTSAEIEAYISKFVGKDLRYLFDQYLRTIQVPKLEYKIENKQWQYRWTNCVPTFALPIKVDTGNGLQWIYPTTTWKTDKHKPALVTIDPNFYVTQEKIN